MYTKDFSELVHSSDIQEDFIFKLGIHHTLFSKSLKTGAYYLDKYVFTDKPILGVIEHNYSLDEINQMLSKDRLEEKSKGRKVYLIAEDDSHRKEFNSIKDCVKYLNSIAPSNKTTLYRHIESEEPYRGYICKLNKSSRDLWINILHIPSNNITTYSSYREAALSFEPKTTGQTIKTYAENGSIYRGVYKITI